MEEISLIIDVSNSILTHREKPPSTSGMAHSEETSILTNPIKRMNVTSDVEMSNQRDEPMNTAGEGATITSAPTSGPTLLLDSDVRTTA